jgi:hypothetical protein
MGLRFEGIATELFVATVLVAVEGERAIANGGVVGRHLVFEFVDAVCERIEVLRTRHGRLEDRPVGCLCEILGQVTDLKIARPMDLARVGRMDTGENLQQRRLAGAVAADERGPATQWQGDRHVAKQHARAMSFAKT